MTGVSVAGAVGEPPGVGRGEGASAAGVNIETLRYYERRGLLAVPQRSPGGHRLYPPSTVTTVRVIKAAQRLGFTLEEVADLLDVGRRSHTYGGRPRPRGRGDAGLQQRARAKLAEVEDRIADLSTIRDTLRAALDAGCDDLVACAGSECCPIPFATLTTRPRDRSPSSARKTSAEVLISSGRRAASRSTDG